MLSTLRRARRAIAEQLEVADPERVATADAAKALELFAEIERLGAAGKVLFARRAAEATTWREQGSRSAASWIADKTKSGIADARAVLESAQALEVLPRTSQALRRGELSSVQLRTIASAAATRPAAEAELLALAGTSGLPGLRERCVQIQAQVGSARAEAARYRAVHAARCVRHWCDPDGAFRLDARLTPDAGAKLLGAVEHEANRHFHEARARGEREPHGAYMADALVGLVVAGSQSRAPERTKAGRTEAGASVVGRKVSSRPGLCIRVDASALARGHVEDGELCHIPGVGPVPVATARRQLPDAFVKLLVTDGVDVRTVCHVGRTVPAHLQTALEERDPTCVVPGCDVAQGLENHHWGVPFAECGTATLGGLARVCSWHHDLLTYEGYTLVGGPGCWGMQEPADSASFGSGPSPPP